jgi:CHAD domain-containing protein
VKKTHAIQWDAALSAGENARLALPAAAREFFALGREAASGLATPEQLHAFRLAAKRFRYTLEIFRPLYGPGLEERLEQVRRIQSLLGDRQDCAVLAGRLRGQGHDDVLHRLADHGRALENKFLRFWREKFDPPGAETAFTAYLLRRPPGAGRANRRQEEASDGGSAG